MSGRGWVDEGDKRKARGGMAVGEDGTAASGDGEGEGDTAAGDGAPEGVFSAILSRGAGVLRGSESEDDGDVTMEEEDGSVGKMGKTKSKRSEEEEAAAVVVMVEAGCREK